jgi:bisphosphoglycerate-independent phosphoglycerate mutase (AlkP superfamily)
LLMNRVPSQSKDPGQARIIDLAPTILSYLGVALPEAMEGLSLL